MDDKFRMLAKAITQQVHPAITGQDMDIVIPAFIQVTVDMVMYGMNCDANKAADMIMSTLQDAQKASIN
jgi:broad specificity polyphosphatase/5'/3'-nucleotidase SurE